jgi:hypothetical protein
VACFIAAQPSDDPRHIRRTSKIKEIEEKWLRDA